MIRRNMSLVITIATIITILLPVLYINYSSPEVRDDSVFFGVSFGGKTAQEAKLLIDKVADYSNFFLINSWDLNTNESALTEVADYATKSGLNFIVFFDYIDLPFPTGHGYDWHGEWVVNAPDRWKEKFLGIYIYEEPGGKQIDTGLFDEFHVNSERATMFDNVTNYNEAAEVFTTQLPRGFSFHFLENSKISKFTSDYALYWFDYLAGYDTVFAEFGWNHNRMQHIALNRGAAKAQGKDWGTIITWTYYEPPYMGSGSQVFADMITSYHAGAKYIILFNYPTYPKDNPYGVLTQEHFQTIQDFWNYMKENPKDHGRYSGEAVLVLPRDFGWGMRNPNDNIWGLWKSDNKTSIIGKQIAELIEVYGLGLDIVYEDPKFSYDGYSKIYYWNQKTI